VNSSMIYLIHYKNLCECHNVPQPSKGTIKEKKTKAYAGTAEAIPGSDTYLSCEILGF
jgi:hypothetical protein